MAEVVVDVEEEEEEDEVDVTEIITDVIVVIRSVRTPALSPLTNLRL